LLYKSRTATIWVLTTNDFTTASDRDHGVAVVWPGDPFPLGATFDGRGTNFSLFSEVATKVDLCVFDDAGREQRIALPETTAFCWHGYLPGVKPGQRYGFRVHGPWSPADGLRANPAKLLLDPYARAIEGGVTWDDAIFAHTRPEGTEDPGVNGQPDERDSAPFVPRGVVVDPGFDWGRDTPPRRPLHETIIYEAHVKGLTARMSEVPPEQRGTYAGLAHPSVIRYLEQLGITAIELMPVHQFVHEGWLLARGLRNYWGYNSIGYFAPHNEYSSRGGSGEQVREFREMVKALHGAGIEVILDVVYNHTAEGNHLGPTFSFKGIDNLAYYRVVQDTPEYYFDYTGTGNSLNVRHPHVLQLIMDSLRYWVLDLHVDGFRFDLASTLARELHEVDRLSAFFDIIQQDPVVSRVKLIAEPWDVGEGGYQVGNFPSLWSEWNGKYRDCVRDYWRGEHQTLAEFASRFTGSSDLYAADGRRPYASVNFVTAHDGFTLRDLVSYNDKHNEANGEDNRDGHSDNRSWNCGHEGPTEDATVNALRAKQQRNFVTTLLLSQGIPMLVSGDECGRTQQGNNNAYCQDTELSWFNWNGRDDALLRFTQRLTRFRREHPLFRRARWFKGGGEHPDGRDIAWFTPNGEEMSQEDWQTGFAKSMTVFLNGAAMSQVGPQGQPLTDDSFFVLFNAHDDSLAFTLPGPEWGQSWAEVLNTHLADPEPSGQIFAPGQTLQLAGRSIVLLCSETKREPSAIDPSV
jgi:glycogen operon protein